MSPGNVSQEVVTDRLAAIAAMVAGIRKLPSERDAFFADERNAWAAESYLRRALEGLLDLGRHILAKVFATAVADYKSIARALGEHQVLTPTEVELLVILAGYRNRMVHFYHEVEAEELFVICRDQLTDLERIEQAYRRWLREHPTLIDRTL